MILIIFFFQAEDGIRDLVRSRGLGDVYKRQLVRPAKVKLPKSAIRVDKRALAAQPPFLSESDKRLSLIHI